MKKILLYTIAWAAGLFLITSCEKETPGGTATESLAGEWYVTVVAVDENDGVLYEDEDLYGIGHFLLDTYNTSSNSDTEMWIDDNTNFWEFKTKIKVDLATQTFQATDAQNEYYDCKVTISNGKILYGAATTPSKMPADSIVFNVTFNDDDNVEAGYWHAYRISGYRYTGFKNDD